MLALDVHLQQRWRGEELLALVTLVELHICVAHEQRHGRKNERKTLAVGSNGAGARAHSSRHLPTARSPTPMLGAGSKVHSVFLPNVGCWPTQNTSEMCGKERQNAWM